VFVCRVQTIPQTSLGKINDWLHSKQNNDSSLSTSIAEKNPSQWRNKVIGSTAAVHWIWCSCATNTVNDSNAAILLSLVVLGEAASCLVNELLVYNRPKTKNQFTVNFVWTCGVWTSTRVQHIKAFSVVLEITTSKST